MRRVTLMLVVMAVMVPLFAVVAYAAAGANAANAAKCEEGGYLDYTDAQGNPFKNEGQCTRYAAKGGQLVPVPVSTADISLNQFPGTISGTGFTPNSQLTFVQRYSPSGSERTDVGLFSTDGTGGFFIGPGWNFCQNESNTGVQVTVTDSTGVSATESLALTCSI